MDMFIGESDFWVSPLVRACDKVESARIHAPYKPEDKTQIARLLVDAFQVHPWNGTFTAASAERRIQTVSDEQEPFAFVARNQSSQQIVGVVLASMGLFRDRREAFVFELAVSPLFQGRGIGKSLMELIIEDARRRGAEAVRLGTHKDAPVRKMYEARGFRAYTPKWQKEYPDRVALRLEL